MIAISVGKILLFSCYFLNDYSFGINPDSGGRPIINGVMRMEAVIMGILFYVCDSVVVTEL